MPITELSHIFFDPTTPDKVSEYDRIKQDLDKSVRENRHLSRQMEQWKRQLAEETTTGNVNKSYVDDRATAVYPLVYRTFILVDVLCLCMYCPYSRPLLRFLPSM